MIHTKENFFNVLATEVRAKYFPNENHHNIFGTNYQKATQTMEDFNNGCLTYSVFISRLAKYCETTNELMHELVSNFIVSFGSYEYKPKKQLYYAVALKDGYWVLLTKTAVKKETARIFKDSICRNEQFILKTPEQVSKHKKVL